MTSVDLVDQVKSNLLITFDDDDTLIGALVSGGHLLRDRFPAPARKPLQDTRHVWGNPARHRYARLAFL
ncbi:hypothetical protein [Actinotignum urinale]